MKEIALSQGFGPDSTNPRLRRAFAHAKIAQYQHGEVTYEEAFDAAQSASQNRKGRESGFGRALGNVLVDAYAQRFDNDTVVVSGLSPAKQSEVAAKKAAGTLYSYRPDVYLVRPNANNEPRLKGTIADPIREGYTPLRLPVRRTR